MSIKIHGRFLVLAALSVSVTFCAPKKPPVDESNRANALITEGRYNEAIAMLDRSVRMNPQDSKARVLLASAYAAQAGIFLSSYMGLAYEITQQARSPDTEIIQMANTLVYDRLRASTGQNELRRLVDIAQSIFVASVRLRAVLQMFNAIPTPKSPQALENIQLAVQILDGDKFEGGPALYRALLRLVLAKYFLQFKLKINSFDQCNANFDFLADQIEETRKVIRPIYNDLILGIMEPARKESLIRAAQRFDIDTGNAVKTIRSLNNVGVVNLALAYQQLNMTCEQGKP